MEATGRRRSDELAKGVPSGGNGSWPSDVWQSACLDVLVLIFSRAPEYLWIYAQVCVQWREAAIVVRGPSLSAFASSQRAYTRFYGSRAMLARDLLPLVRRTGNFSEACYIEAILDTPADARAIREIELPPRSKYFARYHDGEMKSLVHANWTQFRDLAAVMVYKSFLSDRHMDRISSGLDSHVTTLLRNFLGHVPGLGTFGWHDMWADSILVYAEMSMVDTLTYYTGIVRVLMHLKLKALLKVLIKQIVCRSSLIDNGRYGYRTKQILDEALLFGCGLNAEGVATLSAVDSDFWCPGVKYSLRYLKSLAKGRGPLTLTREAASKAFLCRTLPAFLRGEDIYAIDPLCKILREFGFSTKEVRDEVVKSARHARRFVHIDGFYLVRGIIQCSTRELLLTLLNRVPFLKHAVPTMDIIRAVLLREASMISAAPVPWISILTRVASFTPVGKVATKKFDTWLQMIVEYAKRIRAREGHNQDEGGEGQNVATPVERVGSGVGE
jgi:hypothetical protein